MKDMLSNFGILMDILEITPRELTIAVGADKTLVSRWRSGERKLVLGRKWAASIAEYFTEVDATSEEPVLNGLLALLCPAGDIAVEGTAGLLMKWLAADGQLTPEYQKKRRELLLSFFSGEVRKSCHSIGKTVYGRESVKEAILELLESVTEMGGDGELLFVCPAGLELITSEKEYSEKLMSVIEALSKSGKRFTVVLRTDYKMSDVSAFSGPWLAAHLSGSIKSWYYDDFRMIESDKMLFVYNSKIASVVTPTGNDDIKFTTRYEENEVMEIEARCRSYLKIAVQRFKYCFFRHPHSFLASFSKPVETPPCFLFQKLPVFGVYGVDELPRLGFSVKEIEHFDTEFKPLFLTPELFPDKTRLCHILCYEAIDEALDEGRKRCSELSEMAGRSVTITPQMIVERLNTIKARLKTHRNYSVCFMPEYFFEKLGMQIGVWGNIAAIGWLNGEHSTACCDYMSVSALHGFCATVWEDLPPSVRSRATATKKLNAWIKRTRRFGIKVD